jgi:hypothetical protein
MITLFTIISVSGGVVEHNVVYTQNRILVSIKIEGILSFAATWMNLKVIILS